jgi:hypothetical protein
MPKATATLKKELAEFKSQLTHWDYHSRVRDLRKLQPKATLEKLIAKIEAELKKRGELVGGTRRRSSRSRRTTRRA